MKKNTIFRIAAVVLMCALVTACFASSTFARYTSGATGDASATVAKWSIKVAGDEIAVTGNDATFTVDLFDTIDHHANSDVSDKLAPGTNGSFSFADIVNESEVEATVSITAEVTNTASVPLKWSVDGGATWLDELPATIVDEEVVVANGGTITGESIMWKWDFNADGSADVSDTALGIAAQTEAPEVSVDLTITATQVD